MELDEYRNRKQNPPHTNKVFGFPKRHTRLQAMDEFFPSAGVVRSDPMFWTLPAFRKKSLGGRQAEITDFLPIQVDTMRVESTMKPAERPMKPTEGQPTPRSPRDAEMTYHEQSTGRRVQSSLGGFFTFKTARRQTINRGFRGGRTGPPKGRAPLPQRPAVIDLLAP
ncbi:unnamed protein product [Vitrella brassicaformis CCMP3155]|uniref:Uncharacterized protein n=1 Tax=Vitrella brassicaformis (strain CCMP3155) TaxID=1169540 RepID=A0A0G4H6N7_VITBC|nr:unnamed protein product [Vitrella brassicaformis CCMP3155]|eukprot:CEM39500.1 unnamed protein product [Vitrella brassicaformis CCMP3155]